MTDQPQPAKPMTTAEVEQRCRELIGEMIQRGIAGQLDPVVHHAIVKRLRARRGR